MIVLTEPDSKVRSRLVLGLGGESKGLVTVDGTKELENLLTTSNGQVDVVVVGPGVKSHDALELAEKLQRTHPQVAVVLVSSATTPEMLYSALRAGVRDVITADATNGELSEAIRRVRELSWSFKEGSGSSVQAPESSPRVVTVFSGKGGCGKSFVAANVAVLLARRTGKEVALVDLDLQSGDLAIMLQLSPEWTIHDAAEHIEGLDADELRGYMTDHHSGVKLLAAPFEPQLAEKISAASIKTVIDVLRSSFDYVIIDGPASFNEHLLSALDESDECILLTSMDVPSIKNVKVSLATLAQLGMRRERLHLILNRSDSRVGLNVGEVEKSLGTQIDVSLPSSRDVPLSINQGIPLSIQNRKSPVVKALEDLAHSITGVESSGRRRRFSRR